MEKLPSYQAEKERLRKQAIKEYLERLERKREFNVGDLVTTVDGPYANQGLLVVDKRDDGQIIIAPAPDAPVVVMKEADLYHFKDFHEAFGYALQKYPFSKEEIFDVNLN